MHQPDGTGDAAGGAAEAGALGAAGGAADEAEPPGAADGDGGRGDRCGVAVGPGVGVAAGRSGAPMTRVTLSGSLGTVLTQNGLSAISTRP